MSLVVDIEKRLGDFTLKAAFEAETGITGLLGASGCGKSLTLKCIAGIETPGRGRIVLDGRTLYATHGHVHGETNPPPLKPGEFLLCGHTHVPACNRHEGFTYLNPGSVSIPKNGSAHSCCTLEDGVMRWKGLARGGAVWRTEKLW